MSKTRRISASSFASTAEQTSGGAEPPNQALSLKPLNAGGLWLAVTMIPAAARRKLVDVTCRLVSRPLSLEPGGTVSHRYEIFAGPKQPDLLKRFGAGRSTMDDLVYFGWFGWVAPGKMPGEIVVRLNREIVRILNQPEMQERLRQLGSDPVGSSPAEFSAFIKSEHDKWAKVIKQANIRAE